MFYGAFLALVYAQTMLPRSAQQVFFPDKTFSENPKSNEYWSSLYSKQLRSLEEPSLYEESKSASAQAYRFLWLRTFHAPISVRFVIESDGIATLIIKKADKNGGPEPGRVAQSTRKLTRQQTDSFVNQVSSLGFWQLVTHEDPVIGGPDGAQWIIEGVKNGEYHIVDRWSPKDGPVRTLGLTLAIDLGQLKIPDKEIY